MWTYRAELARVIDGDTIDFRVDLGFGHHVTPLRIRLAGLNTPEIRGPDKEAGAEAAQYVAAWCTETIAAASPVMDTGRDPGWPFVLETEKTGKYGRWLATVWARAGTGTIGPSLNRLLLEEGHATLWIP